MHCAPNTVSPDFSIIRWEVRPWRLVANLAVQLATDKAQVRYIVGFAACVPAFEDSLGEDVVELEPMLHS